MSPTLETYFPQDWVKTLQDKISLGAGIPIEKPAMSINMVCGSGLRSVSLATQLIANEMRGYLPAGGAESMSMAPYSIPNACWGVE